MIIKNTDPQNEAFIIGRAGFTHYGNFIAAMGQKAWSKARDNFDRMCEFLATGAVKFGDLYDAQVPFENKELSISRWNRWQPRTREHLRIINSQPLAMEPASGAADNAPRVEAFMRSLFNKNEIAVDEPLNELFAAVREGRPRDIETPKNQINNELTTKSELHNVVFLPRSHQTATPFPQ